MENAAQDLMGDLAANLPSDTESYGDQNGKRISHSRSIVLKPVLADPQSTPPSASIFLTALAE